MARYILFVLFFLLLYAILRHLMKGIFKQGEKSNRQLEPEELIQDPYCQTYLPKRIGIRKRVAGRDYYFCSQECLRKFLDENKS